MASFNRNREEQADQPISTISRIIQRPTMEYKDYYKILGITREATQEEVKRAYRKLARKYHPDVNKEQGAAARFQELGEAYEVLKDPEKRSAYDQFGNQWQTGQGFKPPPGWEFREFTGTKRSAGSAAHGFSDFLGPQRTFLRFLRLFLVWEKPKPGQGLAVSFHFSMASSWSEAAIFAPNSKSPLKRAFKV